jgi:hypothetical protein
VKDLLTLPKPILRLSNLKADLTVGTRLKVNRHDPADAYNDANWQKRAYNERIIVKVTSQAIVTKSHEDQPANEWIWLLFPRAKDVFYDGKRFAFRVRPDDCMFVEFEILTD